MVSVEQSVSLLNLVSAIGDTMDLANHSLVDHHKRVAFVSLELADALGWGERERATLVWAALLHDSGALSLNERLRIMRFEERNPQRHAEIGYRLLSEFAPLAESAILVRHHHARWDGATPGQAKPFDLPTGAHVLHLADTVAIHLGPQAQVLNRAPTVLASVEGDWGKSFAPELTEAWSGVSGRESFWLDASSPAIGSLLAEKTGRIPDAVDLGGMLSLSRVFCHVIDFRSRYTATHSSGVASAARALASLMDLSARECVMMEAAGYLHDLGKLAVSNEILEKPGPLTREETGIMRAHTYHTHCVLRSLPGMEALDAWASLHHERLDGTGYPFHFRADELSLGARIMAVADTFSALTEDRPYRAGMREDAAVQTVADMTLDGAFDPAVARVLAENRSTINRARNAAQSLALEGYRHFASETPPGGR
jgi:HD-GYP domain-containing protein (c-di-GMP phosphodiesterase class II)